MSDMYQSAYRKHHSTEITLLCVTNDIKLAMDSKKATILVMIDLSSVFDSRYHRSFNFIKKTRTKIWYNVSCLGII